MTRFLTNPGEGRRKTSKNKTIGFSSRRKKRVTPR